MEHVTSDPSTHPCAGALLHTKCISATPEGRATTSPEPDARCLVRSLRLRSQTHKAACPHPTPPHPSDTDHEVQVLTCASGQADSPDPASGLTCWRGSQNLGEVYLLDYLFIIKACNSGTRRETRTRYVRGRGVPRLSLDQATLPAPPHVDQLRSSLSLAL